MDDRFEILGRVGHGGMGTIYKARDRRTDRVVALKIIHPHLVQEQEFLKRFLSETRMATSLEHPNIIPVYDVGRTEQGPFIAMMLVAGESLQNIIKKRGPLDPDRAVDVISQIAAALDYAHTEEIVHRDVKPANVLVDSRTGHVYLSDFGIAKALVESDTRITKTGSVMGALNYMAPEQFEEGSIDARVDVYALGCVLFETLSGDLPFSASSEASLIREKLMARPKRLSDVTPKANEELSDVIARALSRNPDDRYGTAGELAEDALAALSLSPRGSAGRVSTAKTVPIGISASPTLEVPTRAVQSKPKDRRRLLFGAVALAGLILLSALAYGGSRFMADRDISLGTAPESVSATNGGKSSSPSPEGVEQSVVPHEPYPHRTDKLDGVSRAYFRAKVPVDWKAGDVDKRNSTRLTNTWMNPDDPRIYVLIDTLLRPSDTDPLENARNVRSWKKDAPGYRETSLERTSLSGKPAAEWVFHVPSEGTKVDFFFGECNVDVAVLGAAPPEHFDRFHPLFRRIAETVKARCQTMELDEPLMTDGIGPIKVGMTPEEVEFAGGIDLDATSHITGECQYLESDSLPEVGFMFVGAILERIDVMNRQMRTLSGIRVGDLSEKIMDTYEGRLEIEPGFYDPDNWETITFVPKNPKDKTRAVFDVNRGTVANIRVGRLPAVHWVEGCA